MNLNSYNNIIQNIGLEIIKENQNISGSKSPKSTSNKLFENQKFKAFNSIFDLLDSDRDGLISQNYMSITSLIIRFTNKCLQAL